MTLFSHFFGFTVSLWMMIYLAGAGEVPLENLCPSEEGGKLVSFKAQDCDKLPCNFVRGKTYKAELTFVPGRNSSKETVKCGSVVWGRPQTIADWSMCDDLTEKNRCPITAGEEYTYETSIKIPPVPPGLYTVHCDIIDDDQIKQLCVEGAARVSLW